MSITEGESQTYTRTFTPEEVRAFAELSRDTQPQHVETDDDGRLVVHGLLTATLPTKIGGDLEVLATRMDLSFRDQVYTGQEIVCTWTHESVTEREDRYELTVDITCRRTADRSVVLDGEIEGLVWKDDSE